MYIYRYIAFIYPPKSTDPGFVYISIHFCSCFVFVFSFCCIKKLKQLLLITSLRLVPVKRSLERGHICRLLEIDRAIHTIRGCMLIIIIINDKQRQTTCFFLYYVVSCIEKKEKKKKKRKRYPILYRPRADFGQVGSLSTLPSRNPILSPRLYC